MENIWIFLIALALDASLGEVPNRFHPVAWLGNFINLLLRYAPTSGARRQFVFGLGIVLFTLITVTVSLAVLLHYVGQFNSVAYVIVAALLLKCTFALRGLWQAVGNVGASLQAGNMVAARLNLQALVSRQTGALDERGIISASIESCAENICDSFIAPTFYFIFFGPAGAVAYRIINTFDAMIGYRGSWEYTGKFAARLDDIANFIPARLSGLMLALAALITGEKPRCAWQVMLQDHNNTESPNAGWPMAAMAGSLGIVLEKAGHYRLGRPTREIAIGDISLSQRILLTAGCAWSALILLAEVAKLAAAQGLP